MDEIIKKVGNFGPFQAMVFAAMSTSVSVCAFGMVFMMYGMYNPGWTCHNDTATAAVGWDSNRDISLSLINNTSTTSSLYDITSTSHDVCASWRQCKNVIFDQSSSTIVTEWNLMCDNAWKASMIITVQMCGVLLGSWACGPLGDRFGRRVSLYFNTAVLTVANLITAFSFSLEMFTALRFFVGFGLGGVVSIAFVYPLEFVGDWWRPVLMSVPTWSIGVIKMALVSFILKDWRQIHLAGAVLGFLSFLPVFWMPESTRWLAVHGKVEKVKIVVRRMASWNRKPHVDVQLINKTVRNIIDSQSKAANPNYFDLFRTKTLRMYSFKFGATWVIIAAVYFMITFGVRSLSGNFYMNMIIFTLIEIPFYACVGPLSNKFGRRFSACFFLALAALACFANVVVYFTPGSWTVIFSIVMVTVAKGTVVAGWTVVTVFAAELYPTIVRNLHSGYLNCVCRFGAMVSGYMIPADESKIYISFLVTGGLLLLCVAIMFSVSDSKGRRMADIIQEVNYVEPKEKQAIVIEEGIKMEQKDHLLEKQGMAIKEEAEIDQKDHSTNKQDKEPNNNVEMDEANCCLPEKQDKETEEGVEMDQDRSSIKTGHINQYQC